MNSHPMCHQFEEIGLLTSILELCAHRTIAQDDFKYIYYMSASCHIL